MNKRIFFEKTGYKFDGNDEEFKKVYIRCKKASPFSDEAGYFDSYLCTFDFTKCDKKCLKHIAKRVFKNGFRKTRCN